MTQPQSISHQTLLSWQKLEQLAKKDWSLVDLFAEGVDQTVANKQIQSRAERFCVQSQGIYFDYAKQCIDDEVHQVLLNLAEECNLKDRIEALLQGHKVNISEDRSALHTALRLPKSASLSVDGQDVVQAVHNSLDRAEQIVNRIREKLWRGYSGKAITDVINIGVGGSDLGPLMATTALDSWADTDIQVHFVSNMDGKQLGSLLDKLNPETSLFIISSKSFGTVDTLSNAQTALTWLLKTGASRQSILRRHFIGISANLPKMSEWGIYPDNQLALWQWVGGRFSMWSAISLAVAIRIGMAGFRQMLAGANAMDEHFATANFAQNLPVMLGLIGVWNSTFLNIHAHTVLPYDGRLRYFPSYLTQLEMESNGKSVTLHGEQVTYSTSPVLWGEIGSNAQHAFYQLLHQGTQRVSCDFIACVEDDKLMELAKGDELQYQHNLSLANCLAQSRVLAFGNQAVAKKPTSKSEDQAVSDLDKFKRYRGNQPSTTILLDSLSPRSLGTLIALYEHKVYVMASIWNINPFDQWGVEMGKKMADSVYSELVNNKISINQSCQLFDVSTDALLAHIKQITAIRK
ncbi:glucose-6-phosphate isomerase [Psychrobacter sp. I-STPA10]|uniref:glucose-6-phosphate isomerase n=1 Tax=Psychrobacter sp. I-STPA10 TaxID=2585769 RepID=UPI001E34F2C7|nr:glucose-6-phosphate isomerase [Psychrobacter sp. I-STPA10]